MTTTPEPVNAYFRVHRDAKRHVDRVETAVVRFARGDVAVDLLGVVHIGDARYYDAVNRLAAAYQAVLFEAIVAKKGDRPKKGSSADNFVAIMARATARRLDLVYQLDAIDYDRPNFVHADMTLREFRQSTVSRNESFLGTRPAGTEAVPRQELDAAVQSGMLEFAKRVVTTDTSRSLKRAFATELIAAIAGSIAGLVGPGGSTIVSRRNEVVAEVLGKQLKAGKRSLAVLYGCGHMPDLETMLVADGFVRGEEKWLLAWNLRDKPTREG